MIPEIMVRKKPCDEALRLVDQFIDRSFREGHPQVRVIHGKGTGTLRRAIQEALSIHPLVRESRLAEPWQGSYGATTVELYSIVADPA